MSGQMDNGNRPTNVSSLHAAERSSRVSSSINQFSNNSVFLAAALVGREAVGDLVSELRVSSVYHVMVEMPGFQIMELGSR